jgi:uncharacterized protein YjiS (DUF1127 family)
MSDVRRTWDDFDKVHLPLLARLGRHASQSLRRWQVGRTIAALESLTDDTLMDIGIARTEIPATALRVTSPEPRHRAGPSIRPTSIRSTNR